jgi:hypothetical protein
MPVVVSNWVEEGGTVALHEFRGSKWCKREIDLRIPAREFALENMSFAGAKQLLFDKEGHAHLAVHDADGQISGHVLYVTFAENWKIINARAFTAHSFFGLGVDSDGVVSLAVT